MKRQIKRWIGLALSAALTVTALAGCAGESPEQTGEGGAAGVVKSEDTAMGRYLEEEISLPEGIESLVDVQTLEDGTLRILGGKMEGQTEVWDSKDGGSTWEKAYALNLSKEDYMSAAALSPTGETSALLMRNAGQQKYEFVCAIADSQGNITELPVTLPGNAGDTSKPQAETSPQGEEEPGAASGGEEGGVSFSTQGSAENPEGGENAEETQPQTEGTQPEDGGMNAGDIDLSQGVSAGGDETGGAEAEAAPQQSVTTGGDGGEYDTHLNKLTFSADGQLYAGDNQGSIYHLDKQTGEILNTYDTGEWCGGFMPIGDQLLALGLSQIQLFELASGETMPKDQNLQEQLGDYADGNMVSGTAPVLVKPDKEENGMYYCNGSGVYRHVLGGSVSEQIIDGNLNSLSNPSLQLIGFTMLEDSNFVVGALMDQTFHLFKYVYSKDTPAKPSKELKVYSLRDQQEVRQAISMYQKAHPDIFISMEIGVTGEDGVTVSDALRTLNTNIAAGKGPDILVLDGMPIDSYTEKGLLTDLSDLIKEIGETDGFYDNIIDASRTEGGLFAVPGRFVIPALQGDEETIEKITDLKSLADQAEQMRNENPDAKSILDTMDMEKFIKMIYAMCASSWEQEDGSLNKEKVQEYFTQLKRIYDLDSAGRDNDNKGGVFVAGGASGDTFMPDLGTNAMIYFGGNIKINAGVLTDMESFSTVSSVDKSLTGSAYKPFGENGAKVYQPREVLGINSKTPNMEESKAFVSYLLSNEAQAVSRGSGFPVNRAGFQQCMEDRKDMEHVSISMASQEGGNMSLDLSWPEEEKIQEFISYIESLDTCSTIDDVVLETVIEQGTRCLEESASPEEAAGALIQKVNLYLSE